MQVDDEVIADLSNTNSNFTVCVRVRPENERELSVKAHRNIIRVLNSNVIVFDPEDAQLRPQRGVPSHARRAREERYAFDRVFDENTSQEEVYSNSTKFLIDGVLNGYNATVFAYGATGAGKTHTMLGCQSQGGGVMARTMADLFHIIDSTRFSHKYEVHVTYLEVYNETIRDLLSEPSAPPPPVTGLELREDPRLGVLVSGLTTKAPRTADEVMTLLQAGNERRTQNPTDANATSSRSHAVMQIIVKRTDSTSAQEESVQIGKLSLIDLAGSERAAATLNRGKRLQEGANINRSLLALGNCINALACGKQGAFVPYRDSKLTRLLKDSLGGNCRTVMIANVSPSSLSYEDTHNTLKYANRAKNIKTKIVRNELRVRHHITQYNKIIEDLRAQNIQLKLKLKEMAVLKSDADLVSEEQSKADMLCEEIVMNYQKRQSVVATRMTKESMIAMCDEKMVTLRRRIERQPDGVERLRLARELDGYRQQVDTLRGEIHEATVLGERLDHEAEKLKQRTQAELHTRVCKQQLEFEIARRAFMLANFEANKDRERLQQQAVQHADELGKAQGHIGMMTEVMSKLFAALRDGQPLSSDLEQEYHLAVCDRPDADVAARAGFIKPTPQRRAGGLSMIHSGVASMYNTPVRGGAAAASSGFGASGFGAASSRAGFITAGAADASAAGVAGGNSALASIFLDVMNGCSAADVGTGAGSGSPVEKMCSPLILPAAGANGAAAATAAAAAAAKGAAAKRPVPKLNLGRMIAAANAAAAGSSSSSADAGTDVAPAVASISLAQHLPAATARVPVTTAALAEAAHGSLTARGTSASLHGAASSASLQQGVPQTARVRPKTAEVSKENTMQQPQAGATTRATSAAKVAAVARAGRAERVPVASVGVTVAAVSLAGTGPAPTALGGAVGNATGGKQARKWK